MRFSDTPADPYDNTVNDDFDDGVGVRCDADESFPIEALSVFPCPLDRPKRLTPSKSNGIEFA